MKSPEVSPPLLPRGFLEVPLAHRGLQCAAQGILENTREAVWAAVRHGYGAEVDVQMSRDGVAVVFHDEDLLRLAGLPARVDSLSAAELGAVTLSSGQSILTLGALLQGLPPSFPLLIEIKDQDGALGPNIGRLEGAVLEAAQHAANPLAVMSFNPHSVAFMARHAPNLPYGRVSDPFRAEDWPELSAAARAGLAQLPAPGALSFLSHNVDDLARADLAAWRAAHVPVLCWTIRSKAEEQAARCYADNITFEGYHPALSAAALRA